MTGGAPAVPLFDLRMEQDDLDAVADVLRSGQLSAGERVEAFESAFAELVGARHAVATSSCTAALHLAYLAAGVGFSDEVIVPSITFAATASAAFYCGGRPILVDVVGEHDFGIDPAAVEANMTPRTRAVCAVHYAGYPAAVRELRRLCESRGVALIEDVAHGPLGDVDGQPLGTWGLAGCFSFFSNKVLSAGEGGALVTDDDDVAMTARVRRRELGYDFDEIRAALVLSRMSRVREDVARRRRLTRRYRRLLADVDGLSLPYRDEDVERSSCYVMPLMVLATEHQRQVREHVLVRHGIQTSLLYPAIHEFTAYVDRLGSQRIPVAERVARAEVTVPLYGLMTDEQQDRVVAALREAL